MRQRDAVRLVRCRLDTGDAGPDSVRYVPVGEFGLWRHLMEGRHGRTVDIEAVSAWIPEPQAWEESAVSADALTPVIRVQLDVGADWGAERVERFFPAETYPAAVRALLTHYTGRRRPFGRVVTPGYFLTAETASRDLVASA
jgi:hypothetical protein